MPRSIQQGRFRARATPQHDAVLPTEIPIPSDERNVVPDVGEVGLRWYVCTTVPQGERRAAVSLRREKDALQARGLAPLMAYVPCATSWRERRRGEVRLPRQEIQTPLLRSYLFVGAVGGLRPEHLDLMAERDLEPRNRHGLIAILGRTMTEEAKTCALHLGPRDAAVLSAWADQERKDAEATSYRAHLAQKAEEARLAAEQAGETPSTYGPGSLVRVTTGPFASFQGIVVGADEAQRRMLAEISIFGRSTPIELDFAAVQLAA
ncbi:transcriptional antiterminator NusG [Methylobacterium sp. BE186]|uniref:transcription termination/antitermination protein NusG n=1 Tax=Methylobacterium sp. BE186 TaxID=2817715 RepID=UPI002866B680|nr:hypothetical protein [Methylobacterium sp. BE186]MDR7040575.1 transcriptional antiterminator NusG [Methylobacterium sp. BE186]